MQRRLRHQTLLCVCFCVKDKNFAIVFEKPPIRERTWTCDLVVKNPAFSEGGPDTVAPERCCTGRHEPMMYFVART
jgi:hypothetical protein